MRIIFSRNPLTIARHGVCLICWLALVAPAQSPPQAVIQVPVANMYSSASADADVTSQAIYATRVSVLQRKDGFTQARTSDSYLGWIRDDDLHAITAESPSVATFAQVVSLSANLYREPDVTKHAPLLNVPFETRLEVLTQVQPENTDYLRIKLLDGREAWIDRAEVDMNPRPLTIAESIVLAKRFIGITYTWGGRSSFGFDCSGFTQMLLRSRGITMPRDADQQAAWEGVVSVNRKDLRPGDLLFFGTSVDHITHTGMFIGKGQFIHDTTYGQPGVKISRLKDDPWHRLLVASRRVK